LERRYRVKKREKENSPERGNPRLRRWPWVVVGLSGVLFVCALGVATSKPSGNAILLSVALWTARQVGAFSGSLSTYFSFLLVLISVIKLAKPGEPLPRFVWGLAVLFVFGASLWHDLEVPFENVFAMARMGTGGGLLGASIDWFFRTALGRVPAIIIMLFGLWIGLCLLVNKSFYTPFTVIWMLSLSFWQWFKKALREFFREEGPREEDIEHEALEEVLKNKRQEVSGNMVEAGPESVPSSSSPGQEDFASKVLRLKEKLQTKAEAGGEPPGSVAPGPVEGETAAPFKAYPGKEGAKDAIEEFQPPAIEQPPLSEDIFYEFPPFSVLQGSDSQKRAKASQQLEERGRIIEKTLLSFGIHAKVVNHIQGPVVTRYELQPGPGVKVASIVNLAQDLALALAAQDVRIEAPIPGKSAVGIEVPNKEKSLVHLRDVLESRDFRAKTSPLTVALGKDIGGRPLVTTLDECVHLLIAGATGAGKSVCINSMIASLLYKARPDQVKLLLVDPKRVELSVWSKIPHLIAPVVCDPKKAALALRWAIKEMEARYEKFTKVGTRDIERYNEIATPPDSPRPAMPYIVIIVDELSDLMMVAPAEVEDAIFRLAQMARASGIHLVVATQRPSVDVLTGTIKANIPSRIAFAVSSQIDSRTILDMAGAERLLGRGDMLFFPVGTSKPIRAQGCYISEREIDELVSFVSFQAKPQFAPGVLSGPEIQAQETEMQEDPLFPQALRIVVEAKQASVSLLQRKLPIGYSRAARLIDAMETKGYVGPYEGSKPREVRMTIQEYMRLFEDAGDKATGDGHLEGADPKTREEAGNPKTGRPGSTHEESRGGFTPQADLSQHAGRRETMGRVQSGQWRQQDSQRQKQ